MERRRFRMSTSVAVVEVAGTPGQALPGPLTPTLPHWGRGLVVPSLYGRGQGEGGSPRGCLSAAVVRLSHLVATTVLCLAGLITPAHAASPTGALTLEKVLAADQAPPGVVFEIVDRDEGALKHALPWVSEAAGRLRARFPGLSMAVVSHGREMFALQASARTENAAVHDLAEQLRKEQGISVHVCETHAGWRGVVPEDFPKYIDVSATGPAQIRDYQALGYVLVKAPRSSALKPGKP